MGDFNLERQVVETRFATAWAGRTPVLYENDGHLPPKKDPYVALFIRDGMGQPITLGAFPIHRFVGVVIVQCFVPSGTGHANVRQLAEQAAETFRDTQGRGAQVPVGSTGTLTFSTPHPESVGPRTGWFQLNVQVPFYRDQIYLAA